MKPVTWRRIIARLASSALVGLLILILAITASSPIWDGLWGVGGWQAAPLVLIVSACIGYTFFDIHDQVWRALCRRTRRKEANQ